MLVIIKCWYENIIILSYKMYAYRWIWACLHTFNKYAILEKGIKNAQKKLK